MGEEKIGKLLLSYSLPVYASHVAGSIYSIISRAFIGNSAGVEGMAAISVYFPFSTLQMAFAFLFGMGGSLFAAITVGQGNKERANRALNTSVQLVIIFGLAIVLFGNIFMEGVMRFFGASENVLPLAKVYGRIMLIGCTFQMIHVGITNYMRVEGKTGLAMIAVLISPIINIIAACIFVLVLDWGIRGAALATVCGQVISAIFILTHFFRNKDFFRINKSVFKLDIKLCLEIMYLGMSSFIVQFCHSFVSTTMNLVTRSYGGDLAISGMGVVTTLQQFIMQPVSSISMGSQALIGYNFGSKRFDRVRELLTKGILTSTVIVVIEYIVMRLLSVQLVSIFVSNNEELVTFGSRALLTYLFVLPLIPVQLLGASFFQAIRKPITSILFNLSRQAIFLVPAVLILPRIFGIDGVLYSGPVADTVAFFVTAPIFFYNLKRLTKNSEGNLQ